VQTLFASLPRQHSPLRSRRKRKRRRQCGWRRLQPRRQLDCRAEFRGLYLRSATSEMRKGETHGTHFSQFDSNGVGDGQRAYRDRLQHEGWRLRQAGSTSVQTLFTGVPRQHPALRDRRQRWRWRRIDCHTVISQVASRLPEERDAERRDDATYFSQFDSNGVGDGQRSGRYRRQHEG